MAVCNIFNSLANTTGTFLTFSQYVEDLTRNYAQGDTYKVVPSKFIALNIDYSNINELIKVIKTYLKDDVAYFAESEGLGAHAKSTTIRFEKE